MKLQDNGQYTIETDDVINNSELTNKDLFDVYGEQLDQHLVLASKRVYQIYHNSYRGLNKHRQVAFMDWWVRQDTDRQNAMRDAIVEYIRGAVYSDMDLRIYENEKHSYTEYVIDILRDGELWFPQTIQYEDSDIE